MSQSEAQVRQTSLGLTPLWILVISFMFLSCPGFPGEVFGAFNTRMVNFINNKQQPSLEASWQALRDTPVSPRSPEQVVTGGSIRDSPGLTYNPNNNRIQTNGWESSAKCMQMSFLWFIIRITCARLAQSPFSIWKRLQQIHESVVVMEYDEDLRRTLWRWCLALLSSVCPRSPCCTLFKVWHFSLPLVCLLFSLSANNELHFSYWYFA